MLLDCSICTGTSGSGALIHTTPTFTVLAEKLIRFQKENPECEFFVAGVSCEAADSKDPQFAEWERMVLTHRMLGFGFYWNWANSYGRRSWLRIVSIQLALLPTVDRGYSLSTNGQTIHRSHVQKAFPDTLHCRMRVTHHICDQLARFSVGSFLR